MYACGKLFDGVKIVYVHVHVYYVHMYIVACTAVHVLFAIA